MPALEHRIRSSETLSRVAGPLLMVGAALLFTLMSTTVKLLPEPYTVWHIGLIRCLGGMLILVSFTSKGKNPFRGHNIPLLIFRGCTGSLAFVTVVTALRILPISTASVLFYAYPVFAAMFAFLIYREKVSIRQFLCIGVLIAGIGVLFDFSPTGSLFGQMMAIAGGLFAGLTVTLIRSLRARNGVVVIYLYFCAAGTIVTLPFCLMNPLVPGSGLEWLMIAVIILTATTAQLMMNLGFSFCKGFEGGVYMSTETVFTAIVGICLLDDPVSWRFFSGALLILGSGLALNKLSSDA
ncbi:MAG: DMT family transporter [Desulfobacterales bacterium]|nr:DMT family transporter [Desulfobacterales bacterium]